MTPPPPLGGILRRFLTFGGSRRGNFSKNSPYPNVIKNTYKNRKNALIHSSKTGGLALQKGLRKGPDVSSISLGAN